MGKNTVVNMKDIKGIIEETAKEMVEQLSNRKMIRDDLSYYKRVEILLYNYNSLKEAIKQKDEDIEDIKNNGLPGKSGSIVIYSTSGNGLTEEERYTQLIDKYKREKQETQRDIDRIDRALLKIKDDRYYEIIKIKFFDDNQEKATDEYIAERIGKDRSTVLRNRKRLMNKLITILFPESVREII